MTMVTYPPDPLPLGIGEGKGVFILERGEAPLGLLLKREGGI